MEPARLEQSALAERMTRDREGTACAHSAPGNNDPGSLRWGEAANMSSTHSHAHTLTHTHTAAKLPTTPVACVCVRVCMCKCVLQPTLSTSSAVPAYLYQVQCGFSLPPPLPTWDKPTCFAGAPLEPGQLSKRGCILYQRCLEAAGIRAARPMARNPRTPPPPFPNFAIATRSSLTAAGGARGLATCTVLTPYNVRAKGALTFGHGRAWPTFRARLC